MIHTKDDLLKFILLEDDGEIHVGVREYVDIGDELSNLLKHNLINLLKAE